MTLRSTMLNFSSSLTFKPVVKLSILNGKMTFLLLFLFRGLLAFCIALTILRSAFGCTERFSALFEFLVYKIHYKASCWVKNRLCNIVCIYLTRVVIQTRLYIEHKCLSFHVFSGDSCCHYTLDYKADLFHSLHVHRRLSCELSVFKSQLFACTPGF